MHADTGLTAANKLTPRIEHAELRAAEKRSVHPVPIFRPGQAILGWSPGEHRAGGVWGDIGKFVIINGKFHYSRNNPWL